MENNHFEVYEVLASCEMCKGMNAVATGVFFKKKEDAIKFITNKVTYDQYTTGIVDFDVEVSNPEKLVRKRTIVIN